MSIDAELRLATKFRVKQNIHDSMLRIDFELGSDFCLEKARLLKESNKQLPVVFDFGSVVRGRAHVVGNLQKPGIRKPLSSRKLKDAVVESGLDHKVTRSPCASGSTWMRTF